MQSTTTTTSTTTTLTTQTPPPPAPPNAFAAMHPPSSAPPLPNRTRRRPGRRLFVPLLLLFVMLHSSGLPSAASACPTEVCTCKWKNGKQTVECAANELLALPDGIDPGTQVLNFTGNRMQVLRSEGFYRLDIVHLQKIYLCRNQISHIFDRAFRGLSNLVELDLSDNLLVKVPFETFADYAQLMQLRLNGNPIREIWENMFKPLTYLSTLEMRNCHIEFIDQGAFNGVENLEWLKLDGNRLKTIVAGVFPKTLHGILLQNNRWTCDCNAADFREWLINYNVPQQTETPRCDYPARLKGEVIKTLPPEELACMPDMTQNTQYMELWTGANISLQCGVFAIPEARMSWWFQGQQLTANESLGDWSEPYAMFEQDTRATGAGGAQHGNAGERKQGELMLYNIGPEHNGTYACMAENAAGAGWTNFTLRVLVKEVPQPEQVRLPYEYMLMLVVGAGASGAIFVLMCCCCVVRCWRRSKRRRRESTKDSTAQLQNSKCSSIVSEPGQQGMPLPILKNGGMGGSVGLGGTATLLRGAAEPTEMMYLNAAQSSNGHSAHMANQMHMQAHQHQHQQQQLAHGDLAGASAQYCSPPASQRNYLQHDTQNPDLINDAESNKCRQPMPADADDLASEHGGGGSVHGSHMSCENGYHPVLAGGAVTTPTTPQAQALKPHSQGVSAVPRFNPLATLPRGMVKDMYQHQVDVHLNPGYFLGPPGPDGYPIDYRQHPHLQQQQQQHAHQYQMHQQQALHQQLMLMHPQQQQQQQPAQPPVNYYRTLPHKPKHGVVAVPRYSMEAEFLQQRPHGVGGAPPFDAYTLRDMRYTAQGYPMQQQQQQQPLQPLQQPKQVAFLDQQQYPSPPDGYKTSDVMQPLLVSTAAPSPATATTPKQQQQHHQWPPCLPGYHQQQQLAIQTATANKAPLLAHQTSLTSPTSSCSSSSTATTQTSQTQAAATSTSGATAATAGSKRCVAAQTLDPKDTIHEQNEEDADDDDDTESTATTTAGTAAAAAATTAASKQPNKLKHLSGPLADSPDEGYVGDSQDQGSDM